MATPIEYQLGMQALAKVVADAIKANVPEWEQSAIPAALLSQIEQQGAHVVIDAVDAQRAKIEAAKA